METVDKKMTAVEWLIDWIGNNQYFIGDDLLQAFKQAKQMEKEKMEKMYNHAMLSLVDTGHGETFDEYYKRIYGK